MGKNAVLLTVLTDAGRVEELTDLLQSRYGHFSSFRLVVMPVEAVLPRPEPEDAEKPKGVQEAPKPRDVSADTEGAEEADAAEGAEGAADEEKPAAKSARISQEELYNDIGDSTRVTGVYMLLVVLSSIVAAVGVLHNNVAVVIGAMVIAPLIGPNVALSFATTLGDVDMARRALKANAVGLATALGVSLLLGAVLTIDTSTPELLSRTRVGLGDITLALASGSAGVLAFTTGVSTTLVGVAVAVALLPPLVVLGLLLGSGNFNLAYGALLLLLANLICINLAGVLTFLYQGVAPKMWWEADRAKRATRKAIALWAVLLFVLVLIIYSSGLV